MANKKKFRLTDLDLSMVSLVPAGDDPMAKMVLAKAAPEDKNNNETDGADTIPNQNSDKGTDFMAQRKTKKTAPSEKVISKEDLDPEVVKYIESLEAVVADVLKDDDAGDDTEDDETDEDADDTSDDDGDDTDDDADDDDDDDVTEVEVSATAKKALAKADPVIKALIEGQQKALAKAEREAKRATAIAKAERNERRRRDFIVKAQALPMINDKPEELAATLQKLDDTDPALAKEVNRLLKAANAQIAKSNLFTEVGKSGGSLTMGERVDSKAAELQKADPTLTYEQAVAKAYESDPSLYDDDITA